MENIKYEIEGNNGVESFVETLTENFDEKKEHPQNFLRVTVGRNTKTGFYIYMQCSLDNLMVVKFDRRGKEFITIRDEKRKFIAEFAVSAIKNFKMDCEYEDGTFSYGTTYDAYFTYEGIEYHIRFGVYTDKF